MARQLIEPIGSDAYGEDLGHPGPNRQLQRVGHHEVFNHAVLHAQRDAAMNPALHQHQPDLPNPPRATQARPLAFIASAWVLAWLSACASPQSQSDLAAAQPEAASGVSAKQELGSATFSVASANPLATLAGYNILKAGGSAVDAAVAVQMVLTLVEPQSSGIGGGAFLLHFDGREVAALDGRETAPAAADEKLFLRPDGQALPFFEAVVGGRAVGVPGVLRMLEMAQRQHGKLPWAALLEPAIKLAENGFAISPRLHSLLAADPHLAKDPVAARYFYAATGQPWPVGHVLKNPELATVLQAIATRGAAALHDGAVAQAIVNKVRQHPDNPGQMTLADLTNYQPQKRAPLCHDHAAAGRDYRVCGFPPPSSGGIAIGQILGLLAHTQAAALPLEAGLPSADWLHLYTDAARLAFADRAQYLADPDFVAPPAGHWHSLLAPSYLAQRAQLIGQAPGAPSMKSAKPGNPAGLNTSLAPMPDQPEYGTSHISIVDAAGRAVAMTSSIENAFGARQMVNTHSGRAGGFLLNNQLSDFSFTPTDAQGQAVANRVQAGKRPRSSMAPTLVFDKTTGQLVLNVGSPGGAMIIHYTAKTLYGVLNWGLSPQAAIDLPNFGFINGPSVLEAGRFAPATVQALRGRGADVRETELTSGIQAITRQSVAGKPALAGGADGRREGHVMGD